MQWTAQDQAELEALEAYFEAQHYDPLERYCPHTPTERQAEFLALDCLEGLYGGAAGGGKSDALLMAALQHVNVPGYGALLLRRTFPELKGSDGLIERSKAWLQDTDATYSASDRVWTFPSGAKLYFGHMQHEADKTLYQGHALQYVGYDETTHFLESQWTYLLTRIRRPVQGPLSKVPLRIRGGTNPGGIGHRWVMTRFGIRKNGTQDVEKATNQETGQVRAFVPAKLVDNAHLDIESYRVAFANVDAGTRDQLERGLWILANKGRIYPFDRDVHGEPELLSPREVLLRQGSVRPDIENRWSGCLVVDLGASESEPTTSFTVVLWHEHIRETWIAKSYKLPALDVTGIAEVAKRELAEWGLTRLVVDHGALGVGYLREFRARHGLAAYEAQKRNKLAYRKLMRGAIERAEIRVVVPMCEQLLEETDDLVWNEAGLEEEKGLANHCSDGALYGWRDSQSFRAVAPAERPAPGRESDEAEAKRIKKRERERYKRRQRHPSWERW